jgi:hypothetical protein
MSSAPPPAARPAAPAPAAPQQSGGGMMSGLMGTVAQGFAFGTGSAVAREAVSGVMGSMGGGGGGQAAPPAETGAAQQVQAPACAMQQQSFYDCLHHSNGDASACNDFFQALSECQSNAKFA